MYFILFDVSKKDLSFTCVPIFVRLVFMIFIITLREPLSD